MGRDFSEIPLAMESLRLWRGMNERTGRETGFRQPGIMYLCENEQEVATQEAWLDQAKLYQVESRLLRGQELEAVMPGASANFVAGLHTPTDGRAEPAHAAPAIAEAARDHSAKIFTNCAVRGIDLHNGRLVGVITERGRFSDRCFGSSHWTGARKSPPPARYSRFESGSTAVTRSLGGTPTRPS
jgi:glycine/D-amino acid oxidase-like deaminating enzyme